jgi:hypothetical protein
MKHEKVEIDKGIQTEPTMCIMTNSSTQTASTSAINTDMQTAPPNDTAPNHLSPLPATSLLTMAAQPPLAASTINNIGNHHHHFFPCLTTTTSPF